MRQSPRLHGSSDPMMTTPRAQGAVLEEPESGFAQLRPKAAGIDLGANRHWVSVPPECDEPSVREFGCYTPDLQAMVAWLKQCGVETVAMESTGVLDCPV
jgi:transposase